MKWPKTFRASFEGNWEAQNKTSRLSRLTNTYISLVRTNFLLSLLIAIVGPRNGLTIFQSTRFAKSFVLWRYKLWLKINSYQLTYDIHITTSALTSCGYAVYLISFPAVGTKFTVMALALVCIFLVKMSLSFLQTITWKIMTTAKIKSSDAANMVQPSQARSDPWQQRLSTTVF